MHEEPVRKRRPGCLLPTIFLCAPQTIACAAGGPWEVSRCWRRRSANFDVLIPNLSRLRWTMRQFAHSSSLLAPVVLHLYVVNGREILFFSSTCCHHIAFIASSAHSTSATRSNDASNHSSVCQEPSSMKKRKCTNRSVNPRKKHPSIISLWARKAPRYSRYLDATHCALTAYTSRHNYLPIMRF